MDKSSPRQAPGNEVLVNLELLPCLAVLNAMMLLETLLQGFSDYID